MSAGLPTEAWVLIGIIACMAVLQCLVVIANVLDYELGLQKLVREVRALREALVGRMNTARSGPPTIAPLARTSPFGQPRGMARARVRSNAKARGAVGRKGRGRRRAA